MDNKERPGSAALYMEFKIPQSLHPFFYGESKEFSNERVIQLCAFCREVISEYNALMDQNGKLAIENAEASEENEILRNRCSELEKVSADAITAGIILAEESMHQSEVGNSMRRYRFGTRSERRKKDEEKSEPFLQSEDESQEADDSLTAVEKSVEFFMGKAEEKKKEEDEAAGGSKAGSKRRGKKKNTSPKSNNEEEEPQPPKEIFESLSPEDLYGEAEGRTLEEIRELLEETRKEIGGKAIHPDDLGTHLSNWKKCTEGHFGKMFENCDHRSRIIDLYGNNLAEGVMPPSSIEVDGYTLRFVGLKEAHYEVEQVEICLPVIHEMQAIYKLTLDGTSRPEAILKAQEVLGKYGITVDGAQKAQRILDGAQPNGPETGVNADNTGLEPSCPDKERGEDGGGEDIGTMSDQNAQDATQEGSDATREGSDDHPDLATEKEDGQLKEKALKDAERIKRERERQRMKTAKKREAAGKPPRTEKKGAPRMETFVHSANKTVSLISRSIWSPALLALVLSIMSGLVVPSYRLATAGSFLLGGINIPVSTMAAMTILVYEKKLKYLIPYFYKDLIAQGYIQADETPLRVLRMQKENSSSKSYVWIYASMAFSPVQIRVFDFEPGRSGQFCKNILASFAGVLLTDAYQGYNLVDNVIHAFCFIHFRRKIYDAYESGSSLSVRSKAKLALDLIDMIFAIEAELQGKGLVGEALASERERRMRPLIQNLNRLVKIIREDKHISKKSKLYTGIQYYTKHYAELTYFLKDGNIPMHNQTAELCARTVSLHRNNSFFWGSPKGATALCAILSIVETARANNLDLYKYLLFLFNNMRGKDFYKNNELMRSLLPYSDRAKAECSSARPKKNAKIKLKGGQTAV